MQWEGARAAAQAHSCNGTLPPASDRARVNRPLHYLAPPDGDEWPLGCGGGGASDASEGLLRNRSSRTEVCAAVRAVAIDRAVMAAVANQNIATDAYLGRYTDLVQHTAGVRNKEGLLVCGCRGACR